MSLGKAEATQKINKCGYGYSPKRMEFEWPNVGGFYLLKLWMVHL